MEFDQLDYLSLLSPSCAMSFFSTKGGVPKVTRQDVLGALAGLPDYHNIMVLWRLNQLSLSQFLEKSLLDAILLMLGESKDVMLLYTISEIEQCYRVACMLDQDNAICKHCKGSGMLQLGKCRHCGGAGKASLSEEYLANRLGVSRSKYRRIRPLLELCRAMIDTQWNVIRDQLRMQLRDSA